ncbi:MAG TPA: hypothetical protein VGM03_20780 [Phycisphaerae bacterium]
MKRAAAYNWLARVRDEMEAARFALAVVLRDWHLHLSAAPLHRGRALSVGDLQRCRAHLELTYMLRLFASWEAILRDYWLRGLGRDTVPELNQLVDSLAARRKIDPDTVARVHDLRRFRNEVVHENLQLLRYDFGQCAGGLGKFIAHLPPNW